MKYIPPYGAPGVDDEYINGDPSIARQGSIIPANAVEFPQREIVNTISQNGFVPDNNDLEQLTRATQRQFVNFCVDTGSANALSVALSPVLQAYRQGLPLRVLVKTTNTGPTTINVNGLGGRAVVRANGTQLVADDLRAGMVALLVDDGTRFQIVNFQGAVGGGAVNNYTIDIPYVQDTGTANNIIAPFTPVITSVVPGDVILVRVAATNTSAVTIAVNSIAAHPVRRQDGQPFLANDILAGEIILLVKNLTYWQMLRLVRSQILFKLSADLTLYVRLDGNDANDGSANDAAHAFRTIQAAIDFVKASFLIAGRTVTIQLGQVGTYQGQVWITNLPGQLVVRGDPAAMLNYIIQGPTAAQAPHPATFVCYGSEISVTVTGVTLSPQATTHHIMESDRGASLEVIDCAFSGATTVGTAIASFSGFVAIKGTIHVYASMGGLMFSAHGSIEIGAWSTLVNNHNVNYSDAFVIANAGYASVSYPWCSFAGSATGRRYALYNNSALVTFSGANATFLPGNQPGSSDASSVYS